VISVFFSSKSHAFAENGRVTYSKREEAIIFHESTRNVDTAITY